MVMEKPRRKILLKIPFYQQTLPTSCGAACLLMVGNFFKPEKFPLTEVLKLPSGKIFLCILTFHFLAPSELACFFENKIRIL